MANYNVLEHPDAPAFEEMSDYVVEPVAPNVIESNREEGLTLVETDLLDHPDINAYVELNSPDEPGMTDIGTVLYRLVQIFGTPQFPDYMAGNDISWRTDDTFKYLFRVRKGADENSMPDEAEDQWLVTAYDSGARFSLGLAEWSEDPTADPEVVPEEVIPIIAVIVQGVSEPVECECGDTLF